MSPTVGIAIPRKTRGRPRVDDNRGPFGASLVKRPKVASSTIGICIPSTDRMCTGCVLSLFSFYRHFDRSHFVWLSLSHFLFVCPISFCRLYLNADHAAISTIRVRGSFEAIRKETWETPNLFDVICQKKNDKLENQLISSFTRVSLIFQIQQYSFFFIDSYFIKRNLNFHIVS